MTDSDTPNPDWVAWLARAECEASGDDADGYTMAPEPVPGWQRLGDVAAKVVAGLTAGAIGAGIVGCALYALRAL